MSMRVQQADEKELKRYIEGWLECKRDKKFKRLWCVLKGHFSTADELCKAYLFCFKDSNTHVREHFIGSYNIDLTVDTVTLRSVRGDKHRKCEFEINFGGNKVQFMADDDITRQRWVYALVDLVGNKRPPAELPDLRNNIRSPTLAIAPQTTKKRGSFIGSIGRSKTHDLSAAQPTYTPPPPRHLSPNFPRRGNENVDLNVSLDSANAAKAFAGMNRSGPRKSDPGSPTSLGLPVGWYHKKLSREESILKLSNETVGSYLIRDCSTEYGSYTLSYKDFDKIKHHKIKPVGLQFQFDDSEITMCFLSPQEAVKFYMESKRNGLFVPKPLLTRGSADGAEAGFQSEETDYHRRKSAPHNVRASNPYHTTPERTVSPKDFMKTKSFTFDCSSERMMHTPHRRSPVNPPARTPPPARPLSASYTPAQPTVPQPQQPPLPPPNNHTPLRARFSKQTSVGGLAGRPDDGYIDGPETLPDQYTIMNGGEESRLQTQPPNHTQPHVVLSATPSATSDYSHYSESSIPEEDYLTGTEVEDAIATDDATYLGEDEIEIETSRNIPQNTPQNIPQSPTTKYDNKLHFQSVIRKHSYINEPLPALPSNNPEDEDDMYLTAVDVDEHITFNATTQQQPQPQQQQQQPQQTKPQQTVESKKENEDDDDSLYINQAAIELAVALEEKNNNGPPPPPLPPRTYNPSRIQHR